MSEETQQENDSEQTPGGDAGSDVSALPEWAQKQIADLRKEAGKYRTENKELRPLADKVKALEDAGKSDLEKLAGDRDNWKTQYSSAQTDLLRLQVALEKAPEGMSPKRAADLSRRLTGGTREELENDAAAFFAEFSTPNTGPEPKPAGNRREGLKPGTGDDPDQQMSNLTPQQWADLVASKRPSLG